MRSKKELKRNLELNLKAKTLTLLLIVGLISPAHANPAIAGEVLSSTSAKHVVEVDILEALGLAPPGEPVWCYNNEANSILITAASREREKCELKLSQERERLEVQHSLHVNTLQLEIDAMKSRHSEIISLKNTQIEDLTKAALDRPNDYSLWWATGGVITGSAITLIIMVLLK